MTYRARWPLMEYGSRGVAAIRSAVQVEHTGSTLQRTLSEERQKREIAEAERASTQQQLSKIQAGSHAWSGHPNMAALVAAAQQNLLVLLAV